MQQLIRRANEYLAQWPIRMWQHVSIAVVVGLVVGAVVLNRSPPVVVERVEISPLEVRAGDDATIKLSVRVRRDCPGMVNRSLVSKTAGQPVQLYDPVPVTLPSEPDAVRQLHIPRGFSVGPAVYKSMISFTCDPLQALWPVDVHFPDVPLIVEASDKDHK